MVSFRLPFYIIFYMARVIITGIAGFMGSHLAHELIKQGHEVWGIDNLSGGFKRNVPREAHLSIEDLAIPLSYPVTFEDIKPDILFHLAADAREGRSQFTPISATHNNLYASVNLFTHAIRSGVKKIVFTSSMSRYGDQVPPFTETLDAKPVDVYGVNKMATEKILKILAQVYDFKWTIIVPHNVFGERQNIRDPYRNVVGIFMNRVLGGKPPLIYGDGKQTRAFTYIENFTPYIIRAGFSDDCSGEVINIGPTEEFTINKLAETVLKALGSDSKPIYYPDRPLEVKHAYCTVDKAKKLLGYETKVSFEEGIYKMAKWAKELGHQPMLYLDELEITNDKTPKTWLFREM